MANSGYDRWTRRSALGALAAGSFWSGISAHPVRATSSTKPAPIDRSGFVPIGGLDQWIGIRGDDMRNPVLLVVHGGPGEAQWPMAAHYRVWERHFTVVHWDQRGAGHSFGRHGTATPDMTLERISSDGAELVEHLCRTLGRKRIILLGHSWGSTVAVNIVQRRPDRIAAYVGTGQVGSWKGAIAIKFDLLLSKARADGDHAAVAALEKSGPPDPDDAMAVFALNDRIHRYWPPSDIEWVKSLRANAAAARSSDPQSYKDFEDGFRFSARQVVYDQIKVDLPATAGTLDTAFFVLQGRDDLITPTRDAIDYFERVVAPFKKLILIPDAGHFAFMTAPDAFLGHLTGAVRPVAIERGA
ncbi:alpha/beta fold hydrolase [Sphingomonas colocasiae]|uniref:Proline iminopeptidase n=1 Tax=Sphingomonas colocasiae TaxID=1848973 RepID=A0ABS7PR84_9SPHN|nr:alpha/beta hydrolase [Sphingomonas colocasiae]MBY8823839.1 alpha/beta hydrolase [Sphingomonas colocasiae]